MNQQENDLQMVKISPSLSVINLNINELHFPVKRQRVAEQIKKTKIKTQICADWEKLTSGVRYTQTEIDIPCRWKQRERRDSYRTSFKSDEYNKIQRKSLYIDE